MQKQQGSQESLLTVAQVSPSAVLVVLAVITLLLLIAILVANVYIVRRMEQTGVGSNSVPQGKSWMDYGSFFVVIGGIVAVIIGFLSILLLLRQFTNVTQAIGFLTAFFGAIVGLVGTYFGVKSSADATAGAQKLAAANGGDTTPPQVLSTNPRDKAEDVPPDIRPTATFSKDMDGATINPNTFKLLDQVTGDQVRSLVPDGVDYDEPTKVATFRPAAALENGKRYGVTITSGVKDKAGNSLSQDKTWHFTVAAAREADVPQAEDSQ
jgi:Bacterial Ig-like domain